MRIKLTQQFWKQLSVIALPPGAATQAFGPAPFFVAPDILVASVPYHQAWVRKESDHIIADLGFDLAAQRLELNMKKQSKTLAQLPQGSNSL